MELKGEDKADPTPIRLICDEISRLNDDSWLESWFDEEVVELYQSAIRLLSIEGKLGYDTVYIEDMIKNCLWRNGNARKALEDAGVELLK
jgi:hypothetical protein